MAELCHAMFKNFCLVAYGAQQAVAHLSHDAVCTALLGLVLAGTEVDACTARQSRGITGDVRIKPHELVGQKLDAAQAHVIGLGHGIGQQFLDFIADREGLFQ